MRIGIAKPDHGIRGGFEIVLERLVAELDEQGHRVEVVGPDARRLPKEPYGVQVPPAVWDAAPEFFRYATLFEAFSLIDARDHDVVVTTQPPSFAIEHPRKLALFFHHHRVYYDLADVYMKAGFAPPLVHAAAMERVHALDKPCLDDVKWFLAGSQHVADRLQLYNDAGARTSVCHVGLKYGVIPDPPPPPEEGIVLCVTRHEFPKRPELVVHAMKLLPERRCVIVGAGGRLAWAKTLDGRLAAHPSTEAADQLWLQGDVPPPEPQPQGSNIRFATEVDDAELSALYLDASVVVAPAYREDYGLTALEAMAHGRPVIVCEDGGGLADMVEHEVTGLVVGPSGSAIADGIDRILDDHEFRRRLGRNGLDEARKYTWGRTMTEFRVGLEAVMA